MNMFASHMDKYNCINSQNVYILTFLEFDLSNNDNL